VQHAKNNMHNGVYNLFHILQV